MSDCCAIPGKERSESQSDCPTCGEKGRPVRALTIRSLTRKDWPDYNKIADGYLCMNADDSTVYFIRGQNLVIGKKDVTVRVGIKEIEEPIYVCYCFRHTKVAIERDFLKHGHSMIEEDIRQRVREKVCSCEFMNPSGHCCLGDVRRTCANLQTKAMLL